MVCRKPDPKFFQLALDRLGIKAEETVFLDDIGHNLAAAAKMGIKTIRECSRVLQIYERLSAHNAGPLRDARTYAYLDKPACPGVNLGQSRQALEELERVLGMKLLSASSTKSKP